MLHYVSLDCSVAQLLCRTPGRWGPFKRDMRRSDARGAQETGGGRRHIAGHERQTVRREESRGSQGAAES